MPTRIFAAYSLALWFAAAAVGAEIKLVTKPHDPYGVPRPAPGQQHVPLRTSFYVQLGFADKNPTDVVLPDSVGIELQADGAEPQTLLRPRQQFATGYAGRFLPGKPVFGVYIDGGPPLHPQTTYTIRVQARSRAGGTLPAKGGTWQFTTEAAPSI